ncbi:MAG: signal recognition particle protein [Chloroflexi bacterium]|nr:signal recognition particle protein [Chloroflexota bacterium]
MFDTLGDRLQAVFTRLRSKGRLTEADVDEALREVRRALLEADVSLRVVKDFVARIRERAVGAEVLQSLTPGQHVVKVVHDELVVTLGEAVPLTFGGASPGKAILVGLQGSGKTTTVGKLALHLRKQGQRPLMVAADVRRPAAIQQLIALGKQLDIPVFSEPNQRPEDICLHALARARELAASVVLYDTAGRLHIDEELMDEVARVHERVQPEETLLVADAMTGQDAVRVAEAFRQRLPLTGLILTKVDGDARGGAALSIRAVTGVPIKYLGVGEKLDALEPFYGDRLASRILGMGDVLTLIERAQEAYDEKQAEQLQRKFRSGEFDLTDFLEQLQQLKKMGPLSQLMGMVPGLNQLTRQLPAEALDEGQFKRVEAIILSMTPRERHQPDILDGSRRRRIARGSGTTPQDVNQLLNQFREMQKLMRQVAHARKGGRAPRLPFPLA